MSNENKKTWEYYLAIALSVIGVAAIVMLALRALGVI